MKKLFIALGLVISLQSVQAQKSVYSEYPDRLFTQGREMFLGKNYVGTIHSLEKFQKQSKDTQLLQEAEYMIVSSKYYRGDSSADQLLKDYLAKYPSTQHRNQIAFFTGSTHFAKKEWNLALFWLKQADPFYLRGAEQEDYLYRSAYANLQEGNKGVAKQQFAKLTKTSHTYSDAASYYLAYIDFQEGNYDQAIAVFNILQSRPEFRENAWFFLIQSYYLKGNFDKTIDEAVKYVSVYPRTPNIVETNRLLGSSYYRIGDSGNSKKYYERYLSANVEHFREDMYQLGDIYYKSGEYDDAIVVTKKVASSDDLLGQAGNMLLGQSYLKTGNTNSALMAFDAAARVEYDPALSEEALYNYVLLTNQGVDVFGQSVTSFQRFLTKYPNSKYNDNINNALATTLLSTQNYEKALEAINSIKRPGTPILEAKQIILYQQGVQGFINGDYPLALGKFNSSINMGNYNMEVKKESFFWRAETLYRQGQFEDAANDYSSYVSEVSLSEKNYLPALYNLGYANFQTKNYNKALSSFSRYTSMETDKKVATYPDALNRVGDCYLFRRDFAAAEKYYNEAAIADPSNADYAQFQKAFVLGLQRKYVDKVKALDNMMKQYPSSPYYANALFEQSRAYVMLNDDKNAIAKLEQLLRENPNSALSSKAGVQLGQLYFNNNNTSKSIAAYKKVIKEAPRTEEANIAINSLEGVYKDINDVSSYVSYVNSLGGGTVISSSRQDTLTFQAAENVYMRGRKTESLKSFENYLASYPQGRFASDAHFYLGNMAFDVENKPSALSHFKEVIAAKNPKYIDDALIFASGIEYDNENYKQAYQMYEQLNQVTTNAGNRNTAQLGMLRTSYLMKEDNHVIASANKLLENKNISADVAMEARFYRAKSYRNTNKLDAAYKDAELVGKNTRSAFGAEAQCMMAEILYKQKEYDKVEKQVLAFMKAGTPHEYWMARAVVVLSDAYKAKGDNFQAKQYIESLHANYKGGEADIAQMISDRLKSTEN